MDRQPLTGPIAGPRALLGLGLLLAACQQDESGPPAFDGPVTAAVLAPGEGGPFEEPVGFVANQRSGRIVPIDLKHATLLSDQLAAPFLSPRGIALGDERQLGQVLSWAPGEGMVSVMAVDLSHQVLVEAPYLLGMDADPVLYAPTVTEPVFQDNDGQGDSASVTGLTVRTGWTTTEDWRLDSDGSQWWVTGSRSGKQARTAKDGESFVSDNGELVFTMDGLASSGDQIFFSTDSGVKEYDLGGIPLGLVRVPGTAQALVGVWDTVAESGALVLWDLDGALELARADLGVGHQPWRIELSAPQDGLATVFVADAWAPLVHRLDLDLDLGSLALGDSIEAAAPVSALAHSVGSDDEGQPFDHLFVAPAGLNRVDLYDLLADEWIDVNPLDGVDLAGIDLFTSVTGMAAGPDRILAQTLTPWNTRSSVWPVALSTFDGSLMMLDGLTGCLVTDVQGPRVTTNNGAESYEFTDLGASSTPALQQDDSTGRKVTTSTCGGLIRSESWTMTYDAAQGGYEVEGSVTGLQQGLAYEDSRYVSDNGGFSTIILSGPLPTTDGDQFAFSTEEGILRLDAIVDARAGDTPFEAPGEPTIFQYDGGPTGGGWDELDRRTFVLLPLTGNDLVLRVRLQSFNIEVVWE